MKKEEDKEVIKEKEKENNIDQENQKEKVVQSRKARRKAKKLKSANERIKKLRKLLVIMLLFLLVIYYILKIIYQTGRFTVVLDNASNMKAAMVMYESKDNKLTRRTLYADVLDFMTNISGDWIPEDINNEADGGHNGDNYIAYTFYLENEGDETIHYWYEIDIDDVIKNVDEAIRVAVYINDNKTVYAKANSTTNEPEENTVAFKDKDRIMLEQRKNFKSGDIDKCTVVIWIEGDDPNCIDDLIGGEMKMHMKVTEEHIKQEQ